MERNRIRPRTRRAASVVRRGRDVEPGLRSPLRCTLGPLPRTGRNVDRRARRGIRRSLVIRVASRHLATRTEHPSPPTGTRSNRHLRHAGRETLDGKCARWQWAARSDLVCRVRTPRRQRARDGDAMGRRGRNARNPTSHRCARRPSSRALTRSFSSHEPARTSNPPFPTEDGRGNRAAVA